MHSAVTMYALPNMQRFVRQHWVPFAPHRPSRICRLEADVGQLNQRRRWLPGNSTERVASTGDAQSCEIEAGAKLEREKRVFVRE
jgi:hypothetical protein